MTAKVACVGLIILVLLAVFVAYDIFFGSFERAVWRGFSQGLDSADETRIEWACGPECAEWLPKLPPISQLKCSQRLSPDGACCAVLFGERMMTEVHVYRLPGNRYQIAPRVPTCLHPDSDPPADYWRSRWVQCDDTLGATSTKATASR
jgi:hypothetical protein